MNMKKIIPGILAAFILLTASVANAGGSSNGNWSFSINWHNGHPTYQVQVGNWQKQRRRNVRKQRRHQRRHFGHHHGRFYHVHRHYRPHRHHKRHH